MLLTACMRKKEIVLCVEDVNGLVGQDGCSSCVSIYPIVRGYQVIVELVLFARINSMYQVIIGYRMDVVEKKL